MIFPVKRLADLGFEILATEGTARGAAPQRRPAEIVRKHSDGRGPDGEPTIVAADPGRRGRPDRQHAVRQPGQSGPRLDGYEIRTAAVAAGIPCVTTVQGLAAAVQGIEAMTRGDVGVRSLQEHATALRGGTGRDGRRRRRRRTAGRQRRVSAQRRGRRCRSRGEVLTVRRVGAYHADDAWSRRASPSRFRPGQFVALAVGGPRPRLLLRRAFSIYRVSARGVYGGTVEFVVRRRTAAAPRGWPGAAPSDTLDVVGPLGPAVPAAAATRLSCLLVGGGYGSAPLFALAEALRGRGCRVDFVLGAASADRLFGALDAKRTRRRGRGSPPTTARSGARGMVTDVLPAGDRATAQDRRRLRLRPDGRCCARSAAVASRVRAARPGARSRSRWPAASGSA